MTTYSNYRLHGQSKKKAHEVSKTEASKYKSVLLGPKDTDDFLWFSVQSTECSKACQGYITSTLCFRQNVHYANDL